jgi:hypothetical protein
MADSGQGGSVEAAFLPDLLAHRVNPVAPLQHRPNIQQAVGGRTTKAGEQMGEQIQIEMPEAKY